MKLAIRLSRIPVSGCKYIIYICSARCFARKYGLSRQIFLRIGRIEINLHGMKGLSKIICGLILLSALFSCSTTRVLQDGEFRLARNKLSVNDKSFNINQIEPYIKQKPNSYFIFGWNPFLNVYNWTNGKGGGWDRFVQKIGVAPVVYDPEMVESSVENITRHLEYLGYFSSTVDTRIEVRKRRVYVDYDITLGKQYPVRKVNISVPGGDFAEDFYSDTSSFRIRPGVPLSESMLDAEADRIATYMRNRGFYTFSKNYFFFEADTLAYPGSAILDMTVNNYTRNESAADARPLCRFTIGDVSISHPAGLKFREKVLVDLNTIKPGSLYSERLVNTTYNRLSALRVFSSVNVEMTQRDTNIVDCEINLSQSRLQGVKLNVEASSNSSGLFGVSPQLSYYHKNIFRGGEWLNLSFMGNFQFKFNDDIRSNEFGVSAGLSFPKFLLLPYSLFPGAVPRTDINFSYNYQSRPEYTRNILSTSFGYTGNIGGRFFYQFYPLQFNVVRLFDLDQSFFNTLSRDPFMRNAYQDHFDLGSGATFYYTTNADVVPRTPFFYVRFQADIAGKILSAFKPLMKKDSGGAGIIWNTPFSQYVRGELSVGRTWRFGRKDGQALATRFLVGAGYAYGNSTALPFEKHFYAGGASSLRGWQARAVGPGLSPMDTTFIIANQTGDMKLEANVEYRFKMFWKVDGAVFLDAGNVWTLRDTGGENSLDSKLMMRNFAQSIAANWGVGIRLDLNFLLLRLDMGMRLHDPARGKGDRWLRPGEWLKRDGFAIHFGVGYPF